MRAPFAATAPDALVGRLDTAFTIVRMSHPRTVFTTRPARSPLLSLAPWVRGDRQQSIRWVRHHSRVKARGRALQELLDEKNEDSDSNFEIGKGVKYLIPKNVHACRKLFILTA